MGLFTIFFAKYGISGLFLIYFPRFLSGKHHIAQR